MCMVYGEVGKLPLQVTVDKHMINYWIRLLNKDSTSHASIIYTITLKIFISGVYNTQWLSRVECLLANLGVSYIWLNQNRIDKSKCKYIIHKSIEDIAHHKWYIDLSNSSMCITYKLFKKQLHSEKHLLNSSFKDRISLTRLRCPNSKLPIYNTIYLYSTQNKLCVTWMHLVMDRMPICPYFKQIREQYLKAYYYIRPSYVNLNSYSALETTQFFETSQIFNIDFKRMLILYVCFKIIIITIIFQMTDYRMYYLLSHIVRKFIYVFVSSNV